jgi:hypothetical protein
MSIDRVNPNISNIPDMRGIKPQAKLGNVQPLDNVDIFGSDTGNKGGIFSGIKAYFKARKENFGIGEAAPEFLETASKLSVFIDREGNHQPVEGRNLKKIALALQDLGKTATKKIEESGLRVYLVDPGEPPRSGVPEICSDSIRLLNGPYKAFYITDGEEKAVLLSTQPFVVGKRECIHEFAHALDDIMVPDKENSIDYYSDDPKIEELFNEYRERTYFPLFSILETGPAPGIWDRKAKDHKREYLAYATEYYLANPVSKRKLEKKDPEMYEYTREFLNKANQDF